MKLGATSSPQIGSGQYADVFRISNEAVVKVFRRVGVAAAPLGDEHDHYVAIKVICEAECEAYDLATAHPRLSTFVPSGFQRIVVSDVLNERGLSIADQYVLDGAYQMEFILGTAVKSTHPAVASQWAAVDAILEEMREIGIEYVYDSSIFVPGSRAPFTVIDFARWDAAAEVQSWLSSSGRLPERFRKQWPPPDAA